MADGSLEIHKELIIERYNQKLTEGEIAESLKDLGVETTFSEIQHHLEKWHIILTPSLVLSKDTDDPPDPERLRPSPPSPAAPPTCPASPRTTTTCHLTNTSLSSIPSGPSSTENYQRDIQRHEQLAYDLQLDDSPLEFDSEHILDNYYRLSREEAAVRRDRHRTARSILVRRRKRNRA